MIAGPTESMLVHIVPSPRSQNFPPPATSVTPTCQVSHLPRRNSPSEPMNVCPERLALHLMTWWLCIKIPCRKSPTGHFLSEPSVMKWLYLEWQVSFFCAWGNWPHGSSFHLGCPEALSQICGSGLGMKLRFALTHARPWIQSPAPQNKDKGKNVTMTECPGIKSWPAYLHSSLFPDPSMLGLCLLGIVDKWLQSLCSCSGPQLSGESEWWLCLWSLSDAWSAACALTSGWEPWLMSLPGLVRAGRMSYPQRSFDTIATLQDDIPLTFILKEMEKWSHSEQVLSSPIHSVSLLSLNAVFQEAWISKNNSLYTIVFACNSILPHRLIIWSCSVVHVSTCKF